MSKIKFGSEEENVVTREEFPLAKAKEILKSETIAVVGYGVQGPAQALNLRDNGVKVIVGQRKDTPSWKRAVEDGWKPGETLFEIEEACKRGTFIAYLLSDAGQMQLWPMVREHLTPGKTLYFSHGFSIAFREKTKVVPPPGIDVVLVAPKGSGRSVRKLFLDGRGINSSYAVLQNASGKAVEKACAFGIAMGSGYLFETTFDKEARSDLFGERGILMGALAGVIEAQYAELRKRGHSPSEAFNETVEELTQSLIVLVGENGMDWMYANCSTTAQRGALDWKGRFRDAAAPVFKDLYDSVSSGKEADIVIKANSRPDYKEKLNAELKEIRDSELWQAGAAVRKLRP
jgi:ketol-acid reductoisomerase